MTDVNPKARLLKKSRIQIYGLHMSSCGYCKRKKESSCSYGVVAASLAADDYLRMMMIGWRRSGTYLYKPAMHVTCCPQYTIRLEVSRFIINKSQRQVLRRVQRYLDTGTVLAESSGPQSGGQSRPAAKDAGDSKPSQSSAVHNLTVELVPAENTEERYELYRKYQIGVHKDDPSEITSAGFNRFLVESPLFDSRTAAERGSSNAYQYGTYHQLYRLDGRLIAVGVIDLIPEGLSSVYLYYDPDEHHLALGKFTALKEIEFCQQNGLKYYYMGYYIHSCPKMRYKGEYTPSELMCPTTLTWHPIQKCLPLLQKHKFTPLDSVLAVERDTIPSPVGSEKSDLSRDTHTFDASSPSCSPSSSANKRLGGTRDADKAEEAEEGASAAAAAVGGSETQKRLKSGESSKEATKSTDSGSSQAETQSKGGKSQAETKGDDDEEVDDNDEEEDGKPELDVPHMVLSSPLVSFMPRFQWPTTTSTSSSCAGDGGRTLPSSPEIAASGLAISSLRTDKLGAEVGLLSVASCPLDIGFGRTLILSQLTEKYHEIIAPMLQEWLAHCGPELGRTIEVKLA